MKNNQIFKSEWVARARIKFGEKYDYSKSVYLGAFKKIFIICPLHGEFSVVASAHVLQTRKNVGGCPSCSKDSVHSLLSVSKEEFIRRARTAHGEKYQYRDYHSIKKAVTITCPIHGDFKQRGDRHCEGSGCPQCFRETKAGQHLKLTTEEWICRAKSKWGDRYDYSKSVYIDSFSPVDIICRKHGEFKQEARVHLVSGCQKCRSSRGEARIAKFLDDHGIKYIQQERFEHCRGVGGGLLKFDFMIGGEYFFGEDLFIEYDGGQHDVVVPMWGGEEGFELRKKNDAIKDCYAAESGGVLIRISHKDFNRIEDILRGIFRNYLNEA